MRSPLFVIRTALRSWREMYDLEEREGRRLTFKEARTMATKRYVKDAQEQTTGTRSDET